MPILKPFHAVRYDRSRVNLEDVVAPPYDVISVDQQAKLYDRDPHNIVRLILGREEDRYSSAASYLKQWLSSGILRRDVKPGIYVLHQTFDAGDGRFVTRKGFVALCRLEEFSSNVVLPHERTLSRPREDRLKLFTATRSNFSQIFSLYRDPEQVVDEHLNGSVKQEPIIDISYDSVRNRLWAVTDDAVVNKVRGFMKDEQVLIADGHHRYETALAYRDLRRAENPDHSDEEAYNHVMMFFSNMEDDGLVIYPTHRVVHSLPGFDGHDFLRKLSESFIVREVHDPDALQTALHAATSRAFGIIMKGDPQIYLATLKPTVSSARLVPDAIPDVVKELDVTLLHASILRDMLGISYQAQEQKTNLSYVKQINEAFEAVKNGEGQVSFILNATRLEEVRAVAKAGHVMPQKSTYFFPKLTSGLVLNVMN